MDAETEKAIQTFPVEGWLQKFTQVYPTDHGKAFYADCPICGSKRKLGVYYASRIAVCGRCKDGGHGRGVWDGTASLPKLIKILEGVEWARAFQVLHELSGIPSAPRQRRSVLSVPDEPYDANLISAAEVRGLLERRGVAHLVPHAKLAIGGKYHERVILPASQLDVLVGFEARALHSTQKPKALYPPGMDTSTKVYTIRSWEPSRRDVAITESIFDAEVFAPLEKNAIGCFGQFKHGQVQALLDLNVERLFWFLDGDAWEKVKAAVRWTAGLFENWVVKLPPKDDPNSLGSIKCGEWWDRAVRVQDELDLEEIELRALA